MTFESPRTTGEPTGSMTHVCDVHEHFTRLERLLVLIYRQGAKLMATLDETIAATTAENTAVDSMIAFLGGLEAQLATALAGAGLSAADQAKVDGIFSAATAKAAAINTALAAGTPAAPAAPAPIV